MVDLTTIAMVAAVGTTPGYMAQQQRPRAPEASTEISILTYNVRGLPWPIAHGRAEALRKIGEQLAALRAAGRQPDLVLIQEGFREEVATLVEASGYRYWAQGPSRAERTPTTAVVWRDGGPPALGEGWGKFTGAGLHVLSDAPITKVLSTTYSSCAGLDCLANKGAMLVRVALPELPVEVDIVNTHLNSRRAAKAPLKRTLLAHNLQLEQLYAFISAHRAPGAPLLIGGDFNVRNAPERYYHKAEQRPFAVVSEFCSSTASGCGGPARLDERPWLRSQDLQAFDEADAVQVRPLRAEAVFTAEDENGRLSDHDGYLVRYRLTWNPADLPRNTERPVEVRPQFGKWGVKVSWKY